MDAIAMLKADHEKIRELFQEFMAAGNGHRKAKQALVDNIFQDLQVHGILEDQIFYPAAQIEAGRKGPDPVPERLDEHRMVELLIDELMHLDVEDEDFADRFSVLMDTVERHIEMEEADLLPEAKARLGEELNDLAKHMQELKRELLHVPQSDGQTN